MQLQTGTTATYVSSRSANALISDLRPTTIVPSALQHLNLVLDELVEALVEAAGSIDPRDIKVKGVPRVFADVVVTGSATGTPHRSPAKESFRDRTTTSPITNKITSAGTGKTRVRTSSSMYFRAISSSLQVTKYAASLALGREAVNEAELELKAWKDGGGGRSKANIEAGGFTRNPKGLRRTNPGVDAGQGEEEVTFPVQEAVEVLRCRITQYSTLGNSEPPDPSTWKSVTDAWILAGGSGEEDVLSPAGLYMTAIIEHISERILSGIGKVVARATSSTTAGMYDLYTALCEDEGLWGFFRRLSVKTEIEELLQITPSSTTYNLGRTTTQSSYGGSSVHLPAGRTSVDAGAGMVPTTSGGIRGPSLDFSTPPRPTSTAQQQQHQRKLSFSGGSRTGRTSLDSPRPLITSLLGRRKSTAVLQRTASLMEGQPNQVSGSGGARESMALDNGGAETRLSLAGVGGGRAGEDEFDALVASAQTVRVTLTPSRLKTFPSAPREMESSPVGVGKRTAGGRTSSSSSSSALASVPFPAGMNTSKRSLHKNQRREEPELDGPHSIPSTRTGTGTGLNDSGTEKGIPGRGPMGRGSDMSGGERRIARDEAQIARDSAPTTETLKELLQSDPPPWASPSPTPKSGAWDVNTARSNTNQVHTPVRSVLPILGAPVRMEPRIEMSPQSARTQETTGSPFTKGRTNEFLELAEFLMNTPPPPPQAQSLADGAGSRRGSSNLVETEATKPDLPSAENAGMLKSLVSRVTWNKSPDKNGPNGNNGLAFDMSLLERNSSASSSSKLRRKSDTAGNGKSRPGTGGAPSPSYGLFSSRDRHIVDEYIGPSTIGMDGKQQRDRDGGLFRSMVEVGPLPGTGSTKESSILAPDTESHGSANPEFFSPHATSRVKGTSSPLDHFPPGIVTGQSQDPPLKSSPNGVEKVASQSIPLADVLQLRQGMAQAKSANDCQTLVDELLSRYGVWQNVALSP